MKTLVGLGLFLLASAPALADPRIHEATLPAWCGGLQSTGACVRGDKDYVLQDGRVFWVDKTNPNDKRFWQIQDADKFGANNNGAEGGTGSK